MSDLPAVVAEILAGRYDGKVLQIIEAIQTRLASGATATYWKVVYDDLEVTQQSITAGEMRTVCDLLSAARGHRVAMLDVHPEIEPGALIAVLAAALHSRKAMKLRDAEVLLAGTPLVDLLAGVSLYEDPNPPKD